MNMTLSKATRMAGVSAICVFVLGMFAVGIIIDREHEEEIHALRRMVQYTNRRNALDAAELRRLTAKESKRQIPPCDLEDWIYVED